MDHGAALSYFWSREIAAASIWSFTHGYVAVEWTVFFVSILSAIAFFVAVRAGRRAIASA